MEKLVQQFLIIQAIKFIIVKIYNCLIHFFLESINIQICNALNNSSSQQCFVCKEKISKLNKIDEMLNKEVDEEAMKYGFSPLHAYIRMLELVLHISYRIRIKMWRVS